MNIYLSQLGVNPDRHRFSRGEYTPYRFHRFYADRYNSTVVRNFSSNNFTDLLTCLPPLPRKLVKNRPFLFLCPLFDRKLFELSNNILCSLHCESTESGPSFLFRDCNAAILKAFKSSSSSDPGT